MPSSLLTRSVSSIACLIPCRLENLLGALVIAGILAVIWGLLFMVALIVFLIAKNGV